MSTKPYSTIFLGIILLLFSNCAGEPENQLYYEEAGSGETIIFVHGSQADYRFHLPQVDALEAS
ncbi:hypothetical protein [Rhodohalobacter sp.]|uniref:alpha/beta fold hydrolase n=1 Tax=Rhodohalobacter sp. TaxID=1974210 RepID=UPI002ACD79F9|nr:hypothetical protein [Rhodohalobacter sp.]MDZ7757760.1 hypothetical protein [Rhodohalobacter sp.]